MKHGLVDMALITGKPPRLMHNELILIVTSYLTNFYRVEIRNGFLNLRKVTDLDGLNTLSIRDSAREASRRVRAAVDYLSSHWDEFDQHQAPVLKSDYEIDPNHTYWIGELATPWIFAFNEYLMFKCNGITPTVNLVPPKVDSIDVNDYDYSKETGESIYDRTGFPNLFCYIREDNRIWISGTDQATCNISGLANLHRRIVSAIQQLTPHEPTSNRKRAYAEINLVDVEDVE